MAVENDLGGVLNPAKLKREFGDMDANNDGCIDKEEFAAAMRNLGVPLGYVFWRYILGVWSFTNF